MLAPRHLERTIFSCCTLLFVIGTLRPASGQPFSIEGPGVDTNDFRVTVFATGLNAPMGMARLSDGSLLVTVSQSGNFFSAAGKLLRLTDTNQDGVADDAGTELYSGLPPAITAVCVASNLVLTTGSGKPITILRAGATPASPLSLVGRFGFAYPSPPNWGHQNVSLTVRTADGFTNRFHVIFQVGSQFNAAPTTNTIAVTNSNISGATGTIAGDGLFQITLIDDGVNVTATNLIQIASGLRNPTGLAFNPTNGDLYIAENGIDGYGTITNREAFSADELNFIAATNLGVTLPFFGFPSNYISYRSNTVVGGEGVQPLIAFQPIPDPFTGAESEGPMQAAFAPWGFPTYLNHGVFIGFHGQFSWGGTANEENPLVFANPLTSNYFHFIRGQQAGIGHLDGLFSTEDSLFVADCVTNGDLSFSAGAGVIYQIQSLVTAPPAIAYQPSAQDVCPGQNATFTITATGQETPTYHWQKNQTDLSNGGHYSGVTTSTLTVSNADSGDVANYRCVVSNSASSTNSDEAGLTLKVSTAITQSPAATNVWPGSNATFSVAATGDGTLTYQWQTNGINLSDGAHYSGTTTAMLTITGADANDLADYTCVVSGGCGSVTSAPVALSLVNTNASYFLVNRAIPDGSLTGMSDTRTLTTSILSLTDLKVRLRITGTFNGDLFCYVAHGSGYSVLLNRLGRTTGNVFGYDDPGLNVTFDDGAGNDVHAYRLTVTGNHSTPLGTNVTGSWVVDGRTNRPDQVLDSDTRPALLDSSTGLDPNGDWTIFLADLAGGDEHTLVSWELQIAGSESPAAATIYGQVQLQGFTGTGPRTVQFVASDSGEVPLQTNDVSLTFVGSPNLADYSLSVPTNTAYLSAKTAWNLRRRQPVTFNSGVATNNFADSAGQLLGGDIGQNNNLVNTADYTVLKGSWLQNTAEADITGDELVNTADYTILKGNWLMTGDPP